MNMIFDVYFDEGNTTDMTAIDVEICMWQVNNTSTNAPEEQEYIITNRLDKTDTFWPPSKFDYLQPNVSVYDLFNATGRNASFNWFTAKFAATYDTTVNLTKWCAKSSEFNTFFPRAMEMNSTSFEF